MEIIELLKPRYKVIADYPNSPYEIGLIITTDEWLWTHSDLRLADKDVVKYPHLFKKLEWWEERAIEQMPTHIKFTQDYMRFKKDAIYPFENWADNWENNCIGFRTGNGEYDLHAIPPSFYQLLPATQEEFNSQNKPDES